MIWLYIPFALQGLAMFFDELHFHRKRGLPLWEKIGHPIDSLSVFVCYLYLYLSPPSLNNLYVYIGLCAFSCVLVTKDEFVHTEKCEAKEHWLHAFLFILHPITFLAAGFIWWQNLNVMFIQIQPLVIFLFMTYQIIYWSSFGKSKQRDL
jgi:hypothetical protein